MIRLSSIYFLKLICFAFLASIFGIGLAYSFRYLLLKIYDLIQLSGVPLYCFPLLATFLCGLIIYRICPGSSEEGVIAYAKATNTEGTLSLKASLCHFFAAFFYPGIRRQRRFNRAAGQDKCRDNVRVWKLIYENGFHRERP